MKHLGLEFSSGKVVNYEFNFFIIDLELFIYFMFLYVLVNYIFQEIYPLHFFFNLQ